MKLGYVPMIELCASMKQSGPDLTPLFNPLLLKDFFLVSFAYSQPTFK